jgi:serine protease AprX
VDGTSFAAPIVAIAAQMIEVNPLLTPAAVRQLLVTTLRLPHVPVDRQGWGVVQAARAVQATRTRTTIVATPNR